MRLALGFEPDPNAVAKNGQDLEFTFPDGGKIVLAGYYDYFADKTLPVMVTESGDEMAGEDFLASLREDLLTAAGPGAGAGAASGGAGDYADDAGALVGGVARMSALGAMAPYGGSVGGGTVEFTSMAYAGEAPFIAITPILPGVAGGPELPGAPVYSIEAAGLNLQVDESSMPGGTNFAGGAAPAHTVSFAVAGNDGLAFVTINGTAYPVANGTLTGFVSANGANGTLTNAQVSLNADGSYTITFTYTQGGPETHSVAGEKDMADNADVFGITVTGVTGATGATTLNVDIVDDIPVARDDLASMEEEIGQVVSGSVLANDLSGYDGWDENPVTTAGTFEGVYGTLVLGEDGAYTYTLTSGVPEDGATETFTYSVRDADGDPAEANLIITIANVPPTPANASGILIEVRDENAASVDRQNASMKLFDGPEEIVSMAFVNDPSAIRVTGAAETLDWTLVDGVWEGSVNGVLALTVELAGFDAGGNVDVTVTQVAPMAHQAGTDLIAVSGLQVTAEDADGSTVTAPVVVNVVDDAPEALADTNSVAEGAASTSGNVLLNDVSGADGWAANPVASPGTYEGQYGSLELDAAGEYTYYLTAEEVPAGAQEVFSYSVVDSDGDSAASTLTITLPGVTPQEPGPEEPTPPADGLQFYTDDSAMEGGKGALGALVQGDGVSYAIPASSLGEGWSFDITQTLPGVPYGELSFVGGALVYTQTSANTGHTDTDNRHNFLEAVGDVTINILHDSGETGTVTVGINIYDDGPALDITSPAIEVTGDVDPTLVGSWAFGADGGTLDTLTVAFQGQEAAETYDDNGGRYFDFGGFRLLFTQGGEIYLETTGDHKGIAGEVAITVTDADGDHVSKTLNLDVKPVDPVEPVAPGATNLVADLDESAMATGNGHRDGQDGQEADFGVSTTDGDGKTWYFVPNQQYAMTDENGVTVALVRVDNDGKLTVTLENNTLKHGMAGEGRAGEYDATEGKYDVLSNSGFTVAVTDEAGGSGNSGTLPLTVNVYDDVPTLTVMGQPETPLITPGEVSLVGNVTFSYGADDDDGTSFTVNGVPLVEQTGA